MLQLGVFGGSYFKGKIKEYPRSWFKNAKLSKTFDDNKNRFKVASGLSRKEWIDKKIYCNFCGKYFGKTKQMFHNPDFKAHPYICNECVKICGAIAKDK